MALTDKMIWAYYVEFSNHMWDDENTPPRYWYGGPSYDPNNHVDFDLWDELMPFLAERGFNVLLMDMGDAVQYERHPEISAPNAWSKDFLKGKLDEMRALGITPIPKLNFSTCHHTWMKKYRRMVSSDEYLQAGTDCIAELCELFGNPELFHLGMDEEDDLGCHASRDQVIFRREKMLWRDFGVFFKACEDHGARPWVWSDYMWNNRDLFIKHMPKEVVQSNWFYGYFRDNPKDSRAYRIIESFEVLDQLGYDQIPTGSTWSNNLNPGQLVRHCKAKLSPDHLKGIMTAAWCRTTRENEYTLKNDAQRLYLAHKAVYPETL